MKKIITTILLACIFLGGHSQNIVILDLNNNDISNTIVQVSILPNSSRGDEFLAFNADTLTNVYKVRRTIFYMDVNDSTQFCWGGTCYGFPTNVSNLASSIPSADTIDFAQNGFHATFVSGPSTVTRFVHYKFFNTSANSATDTVGVTIQYNNGTGIEEQNLVGTVSNVYPNPASSNFNIAYKLNDNARTGKLIFYDVLGKSIKEIVLSNKEGVQNINKSDFNSGIYFYSLVVDNKNIVSKKLIINAN